MADQIANLFLDIGVSFSADVDVTDNEENPLDLTDWTARANMSKGYSPTQARIPFNINQFNAEGIVTISLTPAQTALLEEGRYVYDVDIVNNVDGSIIRVVEGIITVSPTVSGI
jgi:hypothetical protein